MKQQNLLKNNIMYIQNKNGSRYIKGKHFAIDLDSMLVGMAVGILIAIILC